MTRVLLRNKDTQLFYGGCGRWVDREDIALVFSEAEQLRGLACEIQDGCLELVSLEPVPPADSCMPILPA